MAEIDVDLSEGEWQQLKLRVYDNGLYQYFDPQTPGQGYSLNILDVWREYSGAGIKVGIYEGGVQADHPDLLDNYDTSLEIPGYTSTGDGHGTAVAGIIAADRYGPAIGVAFDARIAGVNAAVTNDGLVGTRRTFDIVNQSYSHGSFGDNNDARTNPAEWVDIRDAAQYGRGGLGTIIVQSASNGRDDIWENVNFNANTNHSYLTNNEFSVVVANVKQDGTIARDSTPGSNILVSAFGNGDIFTTDLTGSAGFNTSTGTAGDYTLFGGTSAAAPMVSGIVALMLEANPTLGYRDVQDILAYSARHVGSEIGAPTQGSEYPENAWFYNGAKDWNGGGLHYSEDYGYGLVDAHAAVRLAESWTQQSTYGNRTILGATTQVQETKVTEGNTPHQIRYVETDNVEIETVAIDLRLSARELDDLIITLTSPSGATTVLLDGRENKATAGDSLSNQWLHLTSNAFRGESSVGTWTLRVRDGDDDDLPGLEADNAVLSRSVSVLTTIGRSAAAAANDMYVYTDEFQRLAANPATDSRRFTLNDTDGGIDTINAAATTTNNTVNLGFTTSQIAGGTISIRGGAIENYTGGDGVDRVTGNESNNRILGNRGDDYLNGLGGRDSLFGGAGHDTLTGGARIDWLTGGDGNDTYILADADFVIEGLGSIDPENNDLRRGGIDTVRTSLASYTLTPNVEILTYTGSAAFTGTGNAGDNTITGGNQGDILNGAAGEDTLIGRGGNDVYVVDRLGDTVVENAGEGTDRVRAVNASGYVLADNVENMHVDHGQTGFGQFGLWVASGNGENNVITAQDGYLGGGVGYVSRYEIYGGGGNDTITGANQGRTGDILDGGEGNDTLRGLSGDDILRGGLGADTLDGGTNFRGGDTADYSLASGGIVVDMRRTREGLEGEAAGDDFVSIENVTGSDHSDRIFGNGVANTLKGGAGNDILFGGAGADRLDGGDGDDILLVDGQDVAMDGGAGRDMVFADATTAAAGFQFNLAGKNVEYVAGNAGNDTFDAAANTETSFHIELLGNAGNDTALGGTGLEWFWGGQGTDTFVLAGNRSDYTITTGFGDWAGWTYIARTGELSGDWLISVERLQFTDQTIDAPDAYVQFNGTAGIDIRTGSAARDEMYGGAGNDVLSGDGGTDILSGGAGQDTLSGGGDDDVLFIDNADIVSGGAGFDTVYADDGQSPIGLVFNVADTGVEAVWGGRGADVIDASGAPGNAEGFGVSLYANAGDDRLTGSAYGDWIEGGLGSDTITGGLGLDYFVFGLNMPAGGRDTVADFEDGIDKFIIWDETTNAYADLNRVTVAEGASGAVITYAGGEIVLTGVAASSIDQNDFVV